MTYVTIQSRKNRTIVMVLQESIVIEIIISTHARISSNTIAQSHVQTAQNGVQKTGRRVPILGRGDRAGRPGCAPRDAWSLRGEATDFSAGDDHFVYLVRTIDNA